MPQGGALDVIQAGSALRVRGPFPVAYTHVRGGWLWHGPGRVIWRPP